MTRRVPEVEVGDHHKINHLAQLIMREHYLHNQEYQPLPAYQCWRWMKLRQQGLLQRQLLDQQLLRYKFYKVWVWYSLCCVGLCLLMHMHPVLYLHIFYNKVYRVLTYFTHDKSKEIFKQVKQSFSPLNLQDVQATFKKSHHRL